MTNMRYGYVSIKERLSCLDEVEEAMTGMEFLFTSPWCTLQQGPTQSRRRIWWRSCRAPTVSPFCATMMMMMVVMRLSSPQPVAANKDEVVFHQVDQHLSHQLPHVHAWAVFILEQSLIGPHSFPDYNRQDDHSPLIIFSKICFPGFTDIWSTWHKKIFLGILQF